MRPRILSILLLSLLLPLAGCGGGPDQQAGNQQGDANADRPAAPPGQNQGGGGGRRGPKAHVTLTGPLAFDADVAVGCDIFTDKGLELTLDQSGTRAPQVQVRVGDYHGDGEYPASVVISEHPESGPVREWNGVATINVESRQIGKAKKRTAFNGTFNGTYQGEGGKGTVAGNFRRCALKEMLAP